MRWSLFLSAFITVQAALSFVCVALPFASELSWDELERRDPRASKPITRTAFERKVYNKVLENQGLSHGTLPKVLQSQSNRIMNDTFTSYSTVKKTAKKLDKAFKNAPGVEFNAKKGFTATLKKNAKNAKIVKAGQASPATSRSSSSRSSSRSPSRLGPATRGRINAQRQPLRSGPTTRNRANAPKSPPGSPPRPGPQTRSRGKK